MRTIEITIGMLLIIGLAMGLGFGFYREYDGKNLRDLAGMYAEMREELEVAREELQVAQLNALAARKSLAHYMEIFRELEAP